MAFGYQVLGFGSGVSGAEFMTATGGPITSDGDNVPRPDVID